MGNSERSGGIEDPEIRGGVDDPEIRPESIDDPNIRPDTIDDPDIRPDAIDDPNLSQAVDNPDIRPESIDDPELRTSIDNPDLRAGVDNPDLIDNPEIAPQPTSGGLLGMPKLLGIGAIGAVIVVAAIVALNAGGGTSTPADSGTATITVSGMDLGGPWAIEFGSDSMAGTGLTSAIWVKAIPGGGGSYEDLVSLALGGPVSSGTVATSTSGLSLGVSISRADATGDLYQHDFTSRNGECQVTMSTSGNDISGTFTCASISDDDGHSATITGSFAT